MTNDEAIKWLRRRSVVAVFHEDRIVLVAPTKTLTVDIRDKRFRLNAGDGFTIAMSDPGDSLSDVVQAARAAWQSVASPVDALADIHGMKSPAARLEFLGDINSIFGELAG